MKISIFGLGYVGLTSAACLVEQGHQVIGVDLIQSKIAMVNRGESPINEPGVENLISKAVKNGMLSVVLFRLMEKMLQLFKFWRRDYLMQYIFIV